MVNLTIDGRAIQAEPGKTILQVAQENGIFIPYLCYHPALKPIGSCRICVVEVKPGPPRPVPACTTTVAEGQEVVTNSPRLQAIRQELVKLVLINHALDCPICDKGGECELQDLTHALGIDRVEAAPGPLHHLRPLCAPVPGLGGGHGHQLYEPGLLHRAGLRTGASGLRILRLLH